MRFKVDNKAHAQVTKANIMDIAKENQFISLYNVKSLTTGYTIHNLEDKNCGWLYPELRGKIRIRKMKDGWYLYMPEPITSTVTFDTSTVTFEIKDEPKVYKLTDEELARIIKKAIFDYVNGDVLRPCLVIRKVKGKKKEERARFHGWFQSTMPDKDKVIQQALGIVEFEDGRIQNVKPTSIRFTDDFWEEC